MDVFWNCPNISTNVDSIKYSQAKNCFIVSLFQIGPLFNFVNISLTYLAYFNAFITFLSILVKGDQLRISKLLDFSDQKIILTEKLLSHAVRDLIELFLSAGKELTLMDKSVKLDT